MTWEDVICDYCGSTTFVVQTSKDTKCVLVTCVSCKVEKLIELYKRNCKLYIQGENKSD